MLRIKTDSAAYSRGQGKLTYFMYFPWSLLLDRTVHFNILFLI